MIIEVRNLGNSGNYSGNLGICGRGNSGNPGNSRNKGDSANLGKSGNRQSW